jgi:hypothetical protein
MVPVANLTGTYPAGAVANLSVGGGVYAHVRHVATCDFSALRLVYGNFFDQGTAQPIEQPTSNLITVRAMIMVAKPGQRGLSTWRYISASAAWSAAGAYVIGDMVRMSGGVPWVCIQAHTNQTPASGSAFWAPPQYWPVHFPGETVTRDVTIQPLGLAVSDPVVINPSILKGESFYVVTIAQPNNGTANTGNWPWSSLFTNDLTADWIVGNGTGTAPIDYSTAPPASQASNASGSKAYTPMAVIGTPRLPNQPVIGLIGDSIMSGAGDGIIFLNESGGWGLRMLTDNPASPTTYLYQHFRTSKGSSTGGDQVGPGTAIRFSMLTGCTHIVDEYAVNDIGSNAYTLAGLQAVCLARWATYKALGLKVYATTSTPSTTSTDAWATVAGQTPGANFGLNSKWSQYNDWIRTTPAPLDGFIDVAATVLDPSGTVWKANSTIDGIHPNTAVHIAIAQAVSVTALFGVPG